LKIVCNVCRMDKLAAAGKLAFTDMNFNLNVAFHIGVNEICLNCFSVGVLLAVPEKVFF